MIYQFCRLVMFAILATSALCAQDVPHEDMESMPEQAQTPSEFTPEQPQTSSVPMPIDQETPPLAFASENRLENALVGSINVTTAFDDNALLTSSNHVSDFSYFLLPSIAWEGVRPRVNWKITYSAGFTLNQRLSQQSQAPQDVTLNVQYRVTEHLSVRIRDTFDDTTNLFTSVNDKNRFGVLNGPNESVVAPLARQILQIGGVDVTYQPSPHGTIGGSTTFSSLRYRDAAQHQTGLLDTRSRATDGFYAYQLSPRHQVGATYSFQQLSFQPGNNQTVTHSLLFFDTISIHPNTTISVFAGPEYFSTSRRVISPSILGFSIIAASPSIYSPSSLQGGVTYRWQAKRSSIRGGIVRRIADGGGLLPAVVLYDLNAGLLRQLSPAWRIDVGIDYGNSRSVGPVDSTVAIRTLSAGLGVTHNLGDKVTVSLQYLRQHQRMEQSATPPISTIASVDRCWVSLSYHFRRALGK